MVASEGPMGRRLVMVVLLAIFFLWLWVTHDGIPSMMYTTPVKYVSSALPTARHCHCLLYNLIYVLGA